MVSTSRKFGCFTAIMKPGFSSMLYLELELYLVHVDDNQRDEMWTMIIVSG